jgi:hypothetical protein
MDFIDLWIRGVMNRPLARYRPSVSNETISSALIRSIVIPAVVLAIFDNRFSPLVGGIGNSAKEDLPVGGLMQTVTASGLS